MNDCRLGSPFWRKNAGAGVRKLRDFCRQLDLTMVRALSLIEVVTTA